VYLERMDVTAPAKRHQSAPSLYLVLTQLSVRLDQVQAELQMGIRNQAHFDVLEEEVHAIAWALRAAFRGKGKA
jgi:hypothetical protein